MSVSISGNVATFTMPAADVEITVNAVFEDVLPQDIYEPLLRISVAFVPGLTLADLELPDGYTWVYPETVLGAGVGAFPVIFLHPSGNYTATSGMISVNVVDFDIPCWPSITFDLNGGHFASMPSPEITFTTPSALSFEFDEQTGAGILPRMPTGAIPNGIVKDGHRFTGWFTDVNDATTRHRDDFIVTGDVTLIAAWEPIPDPENFRVGSVGGTGRVTSADATMIARWLITPEADRASTFPDFCSLAADLDGDGEVTADDLVLLARWLVGHNVRQQIAHH